jgi:acyl carrier protein
MISEVEGQISRFISDDVLADDDLELSSQTPLLQGLLDSLALMELVAFIEETYDLSIEPDELVEGNFETLAAIGGFVAGKRS